MALTQAEFLWICVSLWVSLSTFVLFPFNLLNSISLWKWCVMKHKTLSIELLFTTVHMLSLSPPYYLLLCLSTGWNSLKRWFLGATQVVYGSNPIISILLYSRQQWTVENNYKRGQGMGNIFRRRFCTGAHSLSFCDKFLGYYLRVLKTLSLLLLLMLSSICPSQTLSKPIILFGQWLKRSW